MTYGTLNQVKYITNGFTTTYMSPALQGVKIEAAPLLNHYVIVAGGQARTLDQNKAAAILNTWFAY